MKKLPIVLVIDDSFAEFLLMDSILARNGYEVVDANLLWRIPPRTVAVVADWLMPEHMVETRANLIDKAKKSGTPCCIYTGSAELVKGLPDFCAVINKSTDSCANLIEWLSKATTDSGVEECQTGTR